MLQWNRILNALERVCVFGETNRQTERHTERGGKQVQLFHCQVYVSTLHALYAYYAQSSWIFNHVDPIFGMLKRKVEGKCRARSIFCVCKRALLASSWEFVFRIFRLSFCCFAFRHIWRVRDYWDCLKLATASSFCIFRLSIFFSSFFPKVIQHICGWNSHVTTNSRLVHILLENQVFHVLISSFCCFFPSLFSPSLLNICSIESERRAWERKRERELLTQSLRRCHRSDSRFNIICHILLEFFMQKQTFL